MKNSITTQHIIIQQEDDDMKNSINQLIQTKNNIK